MSERPEIADAARRGLQRAGIHLVKAAIELVNGISAFLEEIQAARAGDDGGDGGDGPQRIAVD